MRETSRPRLPAAVAGLLLSAWLACAPARGQILALERPTNLPGVTTSAAPPAGFDALTAGDEALNAYGFPQRPDPRTAPASYARWAHAMARKPERLVPELRVSGMYHGPIRSAVRGADAVNSSNWSGYAALGGATAWSSGSFFFVQAEFIVPSVASPTCNGSWYYSAAWVGIDGFRSADVLQAGTEQDVGCNAGQPALTSFYAWYEWYPLSEVVITNLAVKPGQSMFVQVRAISPTSGRAYLQNLNSNQAVTINVPAPSGTRLIGEAAEWIFERPSLGSTLTTLPNFGADYFVAALAKTLLGKLAEPGTPTSASITMRSGGAALATPGLLGGAGVLISDP
jgi:hypothetical protein